ncbi:MAG TPA: phosphatase PAP2 family protein [Ginsengibacter sp.]
MSFIDFLKRLDKIFFLLINHDSSYRYLDTIMLVLRNPLTWIPLYFIMIWYFFKKAGRKSWQIVLFSLICLAVTDSTSTLFKNIFERARPCYDSEISGLVRHLVDCGGEYSFPSSHAANHFGLATFWFWCILKITGKKWNWLWIWAGLICYAQIYVGKHFPSDIVAGALLGMLIGSAIAKIFEMFQDSKLKVPKISFGFFENHAQN